MFERALEDLFKEIFLVKKTSFNLPGESQEQDCLFIDIENSRNTIKDGKAIAMVSGNAFMFGTADKLPFGFYSKKIERADKTKTKDLFFFDIEVNTRRYQDIIQRGFSFVYFFSGQYDPEIGIINEIDLNFEEN